MLVGNRLSFEHADAAHPHRISALTGSATLPTYDANGALTRIPATPAGVGRTLAYDADGRLERVDSEDGRRFEGVYLIDLDKMNTATASETRYIFTVQSGPGALKNVKVAVQKDENDDVFITAIDAGYLNRPCAASSSSADLYACDVQNAENMGANYKNSGGMPTPGGYGVGFVKDTLAPEMSPSLL